MNSLYPPESLEEQWDLPGAEKALADLVGVTARCPWLESDDSLHEETLRQRVLDDLAERYADKERQVGPEVMRQVEKAVMIQTLHTQWKDHLAAMDYLRQGIHLRGYAQKNPKQEYKREAFELFSAMLDSIKSEVVGTLSRLQLATEGGAVPPQPRQVPEREFEFKHEEFHGLESPEEPARHRPVGMIMSDPMYARTARSVATSLAPAVRAGNSNTATARRVELAAAGVPQR